MEKKERSFLDYYSEGLKIKVEREREILEQQLNEIAKRVYGLSVKIKLGGK